MDFDELEEYCQLVNDMCASLEITETDNSEPRAAVDDANVEFKRDEDDKIYPILHQFEEKVSHYNMLESSLADEERENLKQKIISLRNKESTDLSNLQTKLNYLNTHLKNVNVSSLRRDEETLNVEGNAQKELVETVKMVATLCSNFDEQLKFLDSALIHFDWAALLTKMEKLVAEKRIVMSEVASLMEQLNEIVKTVDSISEKSK